MIGSVAGVLVIESVWFTERKLKIDDPVGAWSVHGVNGIWGVLAVGIFADGQYGAGWNGTPIDSTKGVTGFLYGGTGWGQFAAQAIGAATIIFVMGGIVLAFFKIQNAIMKGGIRVSDEVEDEGVDIPEMGVHGYPEFTGYLSESYPGTALASNDDTTPSTESLPV